MNTDFDAIADTPDVNKITLDNNYYVYKCPHCGIQCITAINEVNCKIFRCGIFKETYNQINPHATKPECDAYVLQNRIYGCAKPYIIDINNMLIFPCDYV